MAPPTKRAKVYRKQAEAGRAPHLFRKTSKTAPALKPGSLEAQLAETRAKIAELKEELSRLQARRCTRVLGQNKRRSPRQLRSWAVEAELAQARQAQAQEMAQEETAL